MAALSRFRRTSIWDVRKGDEVRYNALFQSRTGFIVRLRAKGRIEALSQHFVSEGAESAHIEGLLRDRYGIVQRFKLTEDQRIYRRVVAAASSQTLVVPESHQDEEGHENRDAGKAV